MSDMTREQAIDLLDNLVGMVDDSNGDDYDTALKMGIEALKQQNDCISRQQTIDKFANELCAEKTESGREYIISFKGIERILSELPSAEAVRKEDLVNIVTCHEEIGYGKGFRDGYAQAVTEVEPVRMKGRWTEIGDEVFASIFKCSVCGQTAMADLYGEYQLSRYCPNCGAELSKGDEDE